MNAHSPHRRRGFTLMEVLAAMVLIGVVLPIAMQAANVALRSASQARHRQEASMLAESKLNEVLVLQDLAAVGNAGTFGDAWPEYRWQLTSAITDFSCYEVTVAVFWQERGVEKSLTMSTLLYPSATTTESLLQSGAGS